MEHSSQKTEDLVTVEEVSKVDKLYLDPIERATRAATILNALLKDTPMPAWDRQCLAWSTLGEFIMVHLNEEDQELVDLYKRLTVKLFSYHYTYPEELMGKPDR